MPRALFFGDFGLKTHLSRLVTRYIYYYCSVHDRPLPVTWTIGRNSTVVEARLLSAASCSAMTSEGDNRITMLPASKNRMGFLNWQSVSWRGRLNYRQDFFASNYGQTMWNKYSNASLPKPSTWPDVAASRTPWNNIQILLLGMPAGCLWLCVG